MFIKNSWNAAILLVAITLGFPQASVAETLKSSEFLKWPDDSRNFYFQATIGMAGLVARQNDQKQGDCIDRWYFKNQSVASNFITATMRKFPKYHPQGVILAVLEKQCGKLIYRKN